jgi:hypothetical protein
VDGGSGTASAVAVAGTSQERKHGSYGYGAEYDVFNGQDGGMFM